MLRDAKNDHVLPWAGGRTARGKAVPKLWM